MFVGILNSAAKSVSNDFVIFHFQVSTSGQRRVIITAGSSEYEAVFTSMADDIKRSAYWSNSGFVGNQAAIHLTIRDLYFEKTGKETKWFETCDMEMTIDRNHRKDNGAVSYLWINESGEIMETPIIYPNDKVCFGVRNRFNPLGSLRSFYNVPLGGSQKASSINQTLFKKINP